MKKIVIIVGITLVVIVALLAAVGAYLRSSTKSYSPVSTVSYSNSTTNFNVVYCRPFKKGREIFGELVPFNIVWRTGANEATTFETNTDIKIADQLVPAGIYSLWTIPHENEWEIIFNKEYGQWGANLSGKANRNPKEDQISMTVRSYQGEKVIEQLTIAFEEMGDQVELIIMWDKTTVVVPIAL